MNMITAAFAKVFDTVSAYLPEAITNIGQRLWFNPIPLAINQLYDRTYTDNIVVSYPAVPALFSSAPTLIVVSGNRQNMLAVTSYGDGEKVDEASRNPLNFITEMAGTENIINMNYQNSQEQRKKIKPFLTEKKSLEHIYSHSRHFFSLLFDQWDMDSGFTENISHACINIIGDSALGLPTLTKAETAVITKANAKMRDSEPDKADFKECREAVAQLNHDLLTVHGEKILATPNYIQSKANINNHVLDEEAHEKLLSTYGISNLLVESNLTMLIMTGIAYVNNTPDIRMRLKQEMESMVNMSLEEMRKLPYLDCIYKEALRFASPTPFIVRETSKDANLAITDDQGRQKIYRAPNNSLLFAPIRRMHHDPHFWQNPSEFKPERFENPEATKHFMPYSLGARSCPAAVHFNEIVFKSAILESVHHELTFDKPFEQIPADSLVSRWKQEYFVTSIGAWNKDIHLGVRLLAH